MPVTTRTNNSICVYVYVDSYPGTLHNRGLGNKLLQTITFKTFSLRFFDVNFDIVVESQYELIV